MAFAATWMDPEILILSEVRQSQYNVMLLMYGILKKKTQQKTETDSEA